MGQFWQCLQGVKASDINDFSDIFPAPALLAAELWEWWELKESGMGFNVGADEWLAFCNKINQVRVSKGFLAYPFTTDPTFIAPGKDYYAWIFLQACNAINQINGQVATELLNVASGDDIYAWYFDNLKTALNNAIV